MRWYDDRSRMLVGDTIAYALYLRGRFNIALATLAFD